MPWSTLAGGLKTLAARGISCNIASFVGAATIRENVLGFANRAPTPAELAKMRTLTDQAMKEGALGVASALIYAPGAYAKTDELIALAHEAAKYNGIYISHMRSEGNRLVEAVDELIAIARAAKIRAEIYHLKAAGSDNWGKLDEVIKHVEAARAEGLHITADMYTYTAGATGLDASMPPWVQEGGYHEWAKRCRIPRSAKGSRARCAASRKSGRTCCSALAPTACCSLAFENDKLKPLPARAWPRSRRCAAKRPRKPPWTW